MARGRASGAVDETRNGEKNAGIQVMSLFLKSGRRSDLDAAGVGLINFRVDLHSSQVLGNTEDHRPCSEAATDCPTSMFLATIVPLIGEIIMV